MFLRSKIDSKGEAHVCVVISMLNMKNKSCMIYFKRMSIGHVKQKFGQKRCKLTSWNIILNFSRKSVLENVFCLMDGNMFINGK